MEKIDQINSDFATLPEILKAWMWDPDRWHVPVPNYFEVIPQSSTGKNRKCLKNPFLCSILLKHDKIRVFQHLISISFHFTANPENTENIVPYVL